VTAGVVSALQREIPGTEAVRFIQTDVPINPGNSGGPLLNAHGEVVGINAQIYSLSGGHQGVSFAIPVDVALDAALQMVATGHAVHGALGATAQDVDSGLASAFRLARPQGALIAAIEKDGPAARAGLRIADVVLAIAGQPVATPGDLSSAVVQHRPGDRVQLSVWRRGAASELQVTLGDGSREEVQPALATDRADDAAGLVLDALPAQLQGAACGVLVAQVSGRAARAGLQAGDVLLAIDDRLVDTPATARAWLGRGPAALLVRRGEEQRFFALRGPSNL
jgi:serine protease Do